MSSVSGLARPPRTMWATSPTATHSHASQPRGCGFHSHHSHGSTATAPQPRLHGHGSTASHSHVFVVAVVRQPPQPDFHSQISFGRQPRQPHGCDGCGHSHRPWSDSHIPQPRNRGCGWLWSHSHHSQPVVVAVFTDTHSRAPQPRGCGTGSRPWVAMGWLWGGCGVAVAALMECPSVPQPPGRERPRGCSRPWQPVAVARPVCPGVGGWPIRVSVLCCGMALWRAGGKLLTSWPGGHHSPDTGSKSIGDELHREREQLQQETPVFGKTGVLRKTVGGTIDTEDTGMPA